MCRTHIKHMKNRETDTKLSGKSGRERARRRKKAKHTNHTQCLKTAMRKQIQDANSTATQQHDFSKKQEATNRPRLSLGAFMCPLPHLNDAAPHTSPCSDTRPYIEPHLLRRHRFVEYFQEVQSSICSLLVNKGRQVGITRCSSVSSII